jgi:DNA-binding NtrC family response regulator
MTSTAPQKTALIVADDATIANIRKHVEPQGWTIRGHADADEALELLFDGQWTCVLVVDDSAGQRVRDFVTGLEGPAAPILAVVRTGDVAATVFAMRHGVTNVLEQVVGTLDAGAVFAQLEDMVLQTRAASGSPMDAIIRSVGSPIQPILEVLPQIARADAPVLLTGESGTGKELLAKIIHQMSQRAAGPFITVNCGAIPHDLFESELFGHVKGAFPNANHDKVGMFEAADGGTIFLDEIGELPPQIQVKLLRTLTEKRIQPVGAAQSKAVDVRVISSSNHDIELESHEGTFREDLFYRISVLPVHLPALRERPMDIPLLADHFIRIENEAQQTSIVGLAPEARTLLRRYFWPGNVRELQNIIQRVCILKRNGLIQRDDLPEVLSEIPAPPPLVGLDVPSEGMDMPDTLDRLEARLLIIALRKSNGNKARAARLLGLNRTTFVEKLKRKRIEMNTPIED